MATRNWAGAAPRVAKVVTFAFSGTWESTDLIRASFSNGKQYDFTAGSTTTATVVSNLVTAWNNLDSTNYPEFAEITASADTTTLTLTGDTAGADFTVTLTPLESNAGAADDQRIEGGTSATTGTVSTAASGPNFWNLAANWLENSVPVTGDDVVIAGGPSILYGLSQGSVTLTSLTITPTFLSTSEIGLPSNTNPTNPALGYPEYRTQRLTIGATTVDIDTSSRRMRLDLSSASTTVVVRNTGSPSSSTDDSLDIKATTTANISINAGFVGVNNVSGDTGTIADLNVAGGRVRCGSGCTITNLDYKDGELFLLNGATTITKTGGTLSLRGAVTTLVNGDGIVNLDGTSTITTLHNHGELYKRGLDAITIGTLKLYAGSRGSAGDAPITYTNPVEWVNCRMPSGPDDRGRDVAYWDFGRHKKYTPAAI